MKIAYVPANFNSQSLALIKHANDILNQYTDRGYQLTLRQLYYQFVSRDLLPEKWADKLTGSKNNEKAYDNLGRLISEARMAGLISWRHIVDRTRDYEQLGMWDTPADILRAVADQYRSNLWTNQPRHVEVWVEKDALVDVVARGAFNYRVGHLSCRGYTSQSTMWEAAQRLMRYSRAGKEVHIIHLGDHDPSGIDMSRDNLARLSLFCEHHGYPAPEFERIALNYDQVLEYDPPPNPTKVTDSRAQGYLDEYGEECWELDALEPQVIEDLITNNIAGLIDWDRWNDDVKREKGQQAALRQLSANWPEVQSFLENTFDIQTSIHGQEVETRSIGQ